MVIGRRIYNIWINLRLRQETKTQPNQEQLAEMIGISVDTLNNYKKLTELIP